MDLKDLKKTWDLMSSGKELDENQLREMLGKRTKSLIERIDRNIRIGFLILFALILIFALDDFIFSPIMIENLSEGLAIPSWLIFLGVFSNVLIFTTFIYFVVKYYRVKQKCDIACNLKDTLTKIIATLILYQRLFYLAVLTIILAISSAFVSGLYTGVSNEIEKEGANLADIETTQLILLALIGIVVLVLIAGGLFLFLRWGFRRLYGNYIRKLKRTLKELEEIGD